MVPCNTAPSASPTGGRARRSFASLSPAAIDRVAARISRGLAGADGNRTSPEYTEEFDNSTQDDAHSDARSRGRLAARRHQLETVIEKWPTLSDDTCDAIYGAVLDDDPATVDDARTLAE